MTAKHPPDETVEPKGDENAEPKGDENASAPTVKVGDLVQHTYHDPYAGAGGEDVTDTGQVVELVDVDLGDGQTAQRARVAWLRDVSDPLDTAALTVAGT